MAEAKLTVIGEDLASDVVKKVGQALDETGKKAGSTNIQFDALKKATADLHPEATTASGVFEHMRDAFEHPTDAAKKLGSALVDDLGASLGSVGLMAAAAAAAFAVVGVAAFELAEKAAAAGGYLNDMSEKTGVSVPALDRLSKASQLAGSDLGTMTNALFMLQKGLGEDSEKVSEGLNKIGLTTAELKAAGPDQYMALIAEHMKATEDPSARAAAAMEIFGKAGKELIPTMMKLDDALAMTADITPWSAEQAAEAEHFEMQMKSLWIHAEALGTQVGRFLIPAVSGFVSVGVEAGKMLLEVGGYVTGIIPMWHTLSEAFGYATAALGMFTDKALEIPKVTGDAKIGVDKWLESVKASAVAIVKPGDGIKDALAAWAQADKGLTAQYEESHKANEKAQKDAEELAKLYRDYNSVGASVVDTINRMSGATVEGIKYDLARGESQDVLIKVYGVTKEQMHAIEEAHKSEMEMAKLSGDISKRAYEDAAKAHTAWEKQVTEGADRMKNAIIANFIDQRDAERAHDENIRKESSNTYDFQRQQIQLWLSDEKKKLEARGGDWHAAYAALVVEAGDKMKAVGVAEADAFDVMKRQELSWRNELNDVFDSIPNMLVQAFTGGGGLSGAISGLLSRTASEIGGKLFTAGGPLSSLGNSMTKGVMGMFGDTVGSAFGSMLPGIGSAIGALLGPAITGLKNLFGGVSQAEKDARVEVDNYEKSLTASLTAAQKVEAQGQQWRATNIAVRDAYLAVGLSEAQAQAAVDKLTAASHISAQAAKDAAAEISAVMDSAKKDQADLDAATKKYGFTLEELGPTMQKQQLTQQAQQLENEFRLLAGSGINVNTILTRMDGSLEDFLHSAMKTGIEVPKEMQPIVEKMIAMGELTDENGNKVTALGDSGLSFTETFSQGIDRLLKGFQDVLAQIGLIPKALDTIPTSKTIDVELAGHWNIPDRPNFDDGASMANEAFDLTQPTRAVVGDSPFQSESVLHASTVKDIVRAARSGGGDSSGLAALGAKFDGLQAQLKKSNDRLQSTLDILPAMMRHAMGTA